jgi:TPR repeat protein
MIRIFGILIAVLFLSVGHIASAQFSSEVLKRAQDGDATAQFSLGRAYAFGEGVKPDLVEAVKWWKSSAEQGNADAQYYLGAVYYYGEGVEQDYKEGIKWFRLAAEQGHAAAQGNLGVAYYSGEGVEQDFAYAHMWMDLSAYSGSEDAAVLREFLTEQMTPEQIIEAQKLTLECVRKAYKNC